MTDLIERELTLPGDLSTAWAAVTEPEWLEQWLADEVDLELWPSGEARFASGGQVRTGWVEEVSPPRAAPVRDTEARLAFWWSLDDEPASRVEIVLTPAPDGTRLRISETRPLQVLDLVGVPLPGQAGRRYGPALVAA